MTWASCSILARPPGRAGLACAAVRAALARRARGTRPALLLCLAALPACVARDPAGRDAVEAQRAPAVGVQRVAFEASGQRLVIEILDDDRVHFEIASADRAFTPDRPLFTSPMVAPGRPAGPRQLSRRGRRLVTAELSIDVADDLCVDLARARGGHLGRLCPTAAPGSSRLAFAAEPDAEAFGLGESCLAPGLSGGGWRGRLRSPADPFGNKMVPFDDGACGDALFPVLYAIGRSRQVALFVDEVRAQTWDLRARPWTVAAASDQLRWYVLAGETPLDLRSGYMALTGRPPVPPRAAFGLWVSEYGFDDWAELDGVLAGLRRNRFPFDGFVLDLQWFGGIRDGSPHTRMGRVAFDTTRFPDPAGKLAALRDREGAGVFLIEESFVGAALPEHARLAERGFLATRPDGKPVLLEKPTWWGIGGMVDWSSPAAGDYWHDWKRRPLVDMGVVGHWIDLGEPEIYDPEARYHGFAGIGSDHAAVHNLYNLAWAESIARGYRRQGSRRRPFILSRSGTSGIQRSGVAMWSGDLAARFTTLAAQHRNQVHMSMSGIDYYGSDVGGFWRRALPAGQDEGELYTQWLADSALTDVPLRPHTFNVENRFQTSPDRIGDRASNLASIRLRYQLIPYLYSLAHRAYRTGEPVFPPLVLAYPGDPVAREIGDQKLLGMDLLAASPAGPGQASRRVYLPAGTWYDFHTDARRDSRGEWLADVSLRSAGLFRLPLYARAGAILPLAWVDDQTMNAAGRRLDGSRRDALRLRVYIGDAPSRFTLFEDDGETLDYQSGAVRATELAQRSGPDAVELSIGAAEGTYRGAVGARALALEVVGLARPPSGVQVDGRALRSRRAVELADAGDGWAMAGERLLIAAPEADVGRGRGVRILLQPPRRGEIR